MCHIRIFSRVHMTPHFRTRVGSSVRCIVSCFLQKGHSISPFCVITSCFLNLPCTFRLDTEFYNCTLATLSFGEFTPCRFARSFALLPRGRTKPSHRHSFGQREAWWCRRRSFFSSALVSRGEQSSRWNAVMISGPVAYYLDHSAYECVH